MSTYQQRIHDLIDVAIEANETAVTEAANMVATSIADGGVLHVFGSGHSSLLAQEVFYRAGGLAPINAMLDVNLTIFGTSRPTWVERIEGYAPSVFASYDVREGEVLMIISNSGINAVPIEMAIEARRRGMKTIAVGSAGEYAEADVRHIGGTSLFSLVDVVIDTHVPRGDALVQLTNHARIGAASTILGSVLLNELVIRVASILDAAGQEIPVFTSQNIPEGDAINAGLIERYRPRIPLMKP